MRVRAGVVGLGEVPASLLKEACSLLQRCFGFECSLEGFEPLRREFLDTSRGQYVAESLLRQLAYKARDKILVGLVQGDAYAGRLNFVFGIASPAEGVALVFLPRLRPEFYGARSNRELFLSRLRKEILHEVGHVLGLEHCGNKCVMRFSNSIEEVDEKPEGFCKLCTNKLSRIGIATLCTS